jgi:hypothetical protein
VRVIGGNRSRRLGAPTRAGLRGVRPRRDELRQKIRPWPVPFLSPIRRRVRRCDGYQSGAHGSRLLCRNETTAPETETPRAVRLSDGKPRAGPLFADFDIGISKFFMRL